MAKTPREARERCLMQFRIYCFHIATWTKELRLLIYYRKSRNHLKHKESGAWQSNPSQEIFGNEKKINTETQRARESFARVSLACRPRLLGIIRENNAPIVYTFAGEAEGLSGVR